MATHIVSVPERNLDGISLFYRCLRRQHQKLLTGFCDDHSGIQTGRFHRIIKPVRVLLHGMHHHYALVRSLGFAPQTV